MRVEALVNEFAAEFKRELNRLRKNRHGSSRQPLKDLQEVERGIAAAWTSSPGGDTVIPVLCAVSCSAGRLANARSMLI